MTRDRLFLQVATVIALSGCGGDRTSPDPAGDAAPEAPARYGLATLADIDPDPDVVEVELVAEHEHRWDTGRDVMHGLAYNGSNPGPLLEAKLGDRIIVHFENRLLWDTTIHWHGLRVPEAMDGTPRVQAPVPPEGRFDYQFVAEDAGLFWYHPHHHEGAQIELGLYGPILIHAPGEPELALDQPLLLDDVLIGEDGEIAGYDPHDPDDPHDTYDEDGDGVPTDRFGNALLANGRRDLVVPVRAGTWALFRLVNTASARFLRVRLEDHTMRVIGVDGGMLAEPYETDSLRIGIGERYQVLVHLDGEPGRRYALINTREPEDPFAFDPLPEGAIEMAWIEYDPEPPVDEEAPPFPAGDLPDFAATGAVDYSWVLNTIIVDGVPVNGINGAVWPDVPVPTFQQGGDYTFVVENEDSGSHPWHLHGNRFQVLEIDGEPGPRGWKDTVDMQPGRRVVLRTRSPPSLRLAADLGAPERAGAAADRISLDRAAARNRDVGHLSRRIDCRPVGRGRQLVCVEDGLEAAAEVGGHHQRLAALVGVGDQRAVRGGRRPRRLPAHARVPPAAPRARPPDRRARVTVSQARWLRDGSGSDRPAPQRVTRRAVATPMRLLGRSHRRPDGRW